MVNRLKTTVWTGLILACFANITLYASAATAEFNSTVDRKVMNQDETLTLTLIYNGQALLSEPDTAPLLHDWNIINTSRQQSLSTVNGVTESFTRWLLTIEPKRAGKLLIPTLEYKGNVSNAIEITVNPPRPTQAGDPVFVEADVDKATVYQNQQLVFTVRLAYSVAISNITLTDIDVPNVEVIKINEAQFKKQIGGRPYNVIELTYAVFPEQAGLITLPALTFTAYTGSSSFFSSGKRIRLRTNPIEVTVNPRPSNIAVQNWVPSKGLSARETWSDDSSTLTVGEPITRTITLLGQGVLSNTLPEIEWQETDTFRLYPDQANFENQTFNDGVLGRMEQSVAIVATEVGELVLPPIKINWFDVNSDQLKTIELPGRTFNVVAGNGQNLPPQTVTIQPTEPLPAQQAAGLTDAPQTPTSNVWLWALVASVVINLGLIWQILLLRKRQPTTAPTTAPAAISHEATAFKTLQQLAKANDAKTYRAQLSRWLSSTPPNWKLNNTNQLKAALSASAWTELQKIDQSLYSPAENDGDIEVLQQAISELRNKYLQSDTSNKQTLPPLYPN